MTGFFPNREHRRFLAACGGSRAGGQLLAEMSFTLTIASDDLDAMLTQSDHAARMAGTVTCPALSAEPLTISNGRFGLFVADPARVDARDMVYRMTLNAADGRSWFFHGVKLITKTSLLEAWPQTTTLYTTVFASEADGAPVIVGKGILHIQPADFARQLATIEVERVERRTRLLDSPRSRGLANSSLVSCTTVMVACWRRIRSSIRMRHRG